MGEPKATPKAPGRFELYVEGPRLQVEPAVRALVAGRAQHPARRRGLEGSAAPRARPLAGFESWRRRWRLVAAPDRFRPSRHPPADRQSPAPR